MTNYSLHEISGFVAHFKVNWTISYDLQIFMVKYMQKQASQVVLMVKNLPTKARDSREKISIPGSGRSPGGGHGNPLQCSCLENPTDRKAWRAIVHRVSKSWTRVKRLNYMPTYAEASKYILSWRADSTI